MKFEKVLIAEEIARTKGLSEIRLNEKSLGNVVALVGQNGAGKSRILKFVQHYFEHISPENFLQGHISGISKGRYKSQNKLFASAKSLFQKYLDSGLGVNSPSLVASIDQANSVLANLTRNGVQDYIKVVDSETIKEIKANLSNNLSFEEILNNNPENNSITTKPINEFNELNGQSTIAFIKKNTDKIVTDEVNLFLKNKNSPEYHKNPNIIYKDLGLSASFILFEKFKKYILKFLGKEFSYEADSKENITSILLFDGIKFDFSSLSPGEKTLLAYAMLFFYLDINSSSKLNECIVIIDEPELHLHPTAQIELINSLRSMLNKGQLWIATHSIHLLSHLNYDEIFLVKNGKIVPPSRITPGESMIELMGLQGHIQELQTFISSISEWAYANFMIQCFKDPDVVLNIDNNDPQYLLFKNWLTSNSEFRLLDYGAGRGRIGYAINEDQDLREKIEYIALEPNEIFHPVIQELDNLKGIISTTDHIANEAFDVVLMCNVLHEISPEYWVGNFIEIKRILKKKGMLLVIEDNNLPKGEHAHEFGYLVLGATQLKILLNAENLLTLKSNAPKHKDRFTFCAINKTDINPNRESVINAIDSLKSDSYAQIKKIRQGTKDLANGRHYAFLSQTYINSTLALENIAHDGLSH